MQGITLFVVKDTRKELMPGLKRQSESIPGRDGEIIFETKLMPRLIELHCITNEGITYTEREQRKTQIREFFDPKAGVREITFDDEPGKVYYGRPYGVSSIAQQPNHMEIIVPIRCSDPYIYSNENQVEKTFTVTGDYMEIEVNGTEETFCIIQAENLATSSIAGGFNIIPAVDAEQQVDKLKYNGQIGVGEMVEIDSNKETAYIGEENVVHLLSPYFITLTSNINRLYYEDNEGSREVKVVVKWRDKWV